MTKVRTWAGLDVHAAASLACVVDAPSGEMSVQRLTGRTAELAAFCARLPAPVRVAYEAGPTGFELARVLEMAGVACVVAAPGKIERPAQDRVKTDRRDAERLVRLLMIGGLHPVRVPSSEEEALRDLVRAREDIRGDLMRARHRLSKLLLRHDVRYEDTASAWTRAHRAWLSRVELGERAAQATLLDYLGSVDALIVRRDTIERTIGELVPNSPWAGQVARLRCLRGIDTLSAVGLCAEIGEFARFEHPRQLMSYLGLVPSEHSSGQTRRQGAITKSGSRHARRLLVEAAWHYRRPPRNGTTLQRRQEGQPAQALAISWKAQQRLHQLWRRLDSERGKRKTIVAVAVARHLAGFCWAITNTNPNA
jgi:transposase